MVTYNFYTTNYHGALTGAQFNRHLSYADALVNEITFGRASDNTNMDEVKLAVCSACDILQSDSVRRSQGVRVASENTDGYSVSYYTGNGATAEEALKAEIQERIKVYLACTGLMNWGVYE